MKYLPELIFGIIEVILVFVQLFSSLPEKFFDDRFVAFAAFVNLQIVILFIYLGVRAVFDRGIVQATVKEIGEQLSPLIETATEVRALREEEFYKVFGESIDRAKSGVAITHLDIKPPISAPGTSTGSYYETFKKRVKSKHKVTFRRVERASKEKRDWIRQLVSDFSGVKHFSFACLMVDQTERLLPHVSVQLVDEELTFLVAVAEHSRPHGTRDILLRGREFKELWEDYYDRVLWQPARKIIENGKLNEAGWEWLQEQISGQ